MQLRRTGPSAVLLAGIVRSSIVLGGSGHNDLLRLRGRSADSVGWGDAHAAARNCAVSGRGSWEYPAYDETYHSVWKSLKTPPPMSAARPKPAFLMLIYQRIAFPESWEAFFKGGDRWKLIVNVKYFMGVKDFPEFFQPYITTELSTVQNSWCNLGDLMLAMMGLALKDPDVSHCVFVSGDSMPVSPLPAVVGELSRDPRTRLCVDKEWQRAEMWSVMSRSHAQLFTSNSHILLTMITKTPTLCTDEDIFYWPLKTRGEKLLDRCVMMTDWSDSPKAYRRVAADCRCPAMVQGPKTPGSCAHPSVFRNLTGSGYSQLVKSPAAFWFSRKFPGDNGPGDNGKVLAWLDGEGPLDAANAKRLKKSIESKMPDVGTLIVTDRGDPKAQVEMSEPAAAALEQRVVGEFPAVPLEPIEPT